MRYIYYIVAIVIVVSILSVYGVFDTRVEISKPFISVNDRIISESEFADMLSRKPPDMTRDQFIESVIEKQLLIQEAVRENINKEKNFQESVENFYEQSLIRILLDRKQKSIVVDVTQEELEKYETLLGKKLEITKFSYRSLKDARNNMHGEKEKIVSEFIDLSDDLKYVLLFLEEGQTSEPRTTEFGYFVYRLDKISPTELEQAITIFNMRKVSVFLQDKKKEKVTAEWISSIREKAKIWRK